MCIKLVNYRDKYTEMHGQQNVKICNWVVTRWQWLFYMYTKYEIGYQNIKLVTQNMKLVTQNMKLVTQNMKLDN